MTGHEQFTQNYKIMIQRTKNDFHETSVVGNGHTSLIMEFSTNKLHLALMFISESVLIDLQKVNALSCPKFPMLSH